MNQLSADQLGFAELCVCCEVGVAHARNRKRQIPIPNSTIISMEQKLELPEPLKHHWERRSSVLHNNGLKEEFLSNALLVTLHCTIFTLYVVYIVQSHSKGAHI